ncbi:MAG: hypothetical protein KAI39_12635, partial [Desulfobulbaceae bacterium]|nr:hypothetical protein [Desulfobulbaceae bacterium]
MKKDDKTPTIFARLSLKKLIQVALLSAVFILLTVSTLAVREWYIHVHSARLLEESRVIRAHSGEFSDYIIEQLLTGQILNMEEMEYEASIIGEKGSELAGQALIPEEFKLLLVSRSDMTKLMSRLRLLSTKPDGSEKHLVIYRMLRDISSRITKFDEGFDRYVQQQWQAIQNLLRGFLAIATMFLTMLLFLLHVYVTRPFFGVIDSIRKALGNKTSDNETVDSILAITRLGRKVHTELAACTLYKNILQTIPDPGPVTDNQNRSGGSVWKLAAPLLQQHPHYKLVSTSFFGDNGIGNNIPDYLREEVQSRGAVIFRETDDLTFSRIRKILPCSSEIHAGICFSISSASGLSGMVTILSDNPDSFSGQEVATLTTLLRFLEYIDSHGTDQNCGETGFALEELRTISLSLLNELPPHRGCHNIMNYANGIINCAQIIRDQEVFPDLQESENQKLMTDLWESGQKIAATVNRLRSLQQLYSNPVDSVDDAITLLSSWLELQFPEITRLLEIKTVPPLPPVHIPGSDLFLAMAL